MTRAGMIDGCDGMLAHERCRFCQKLLQVLSRCRRRFFADGSQRQSHCGVSLALCECAPPRVGALRRSISHVSVMQEPENNPVTNFPRAALIFCYASLRFAPVVFRISQAEKSRSIRLLVAQCRVSVSMRCWIARSADRFGRLRIS